MNKEEFEFAWDQLSQDFYEAEEPDRFIIYIQICDLLDAHPDYHDRGDRTIPGDDSDASETNREVRWGPVEGIGPDDIDPVIGKGELEW